MEQATILRAAMAASIFVAASVQASALDDIEDFLDYPPDFEIPFWTASGGTSLVVWCDWISVGDDWDFAYQAMDEAGNVVRFPEGVPESTKGDIPEFWLWSAIAKAARADAIRMATAARHALDDYLKKYAELKSKWLSGGLDGKGECDVTEGKATLPRVPMEIKGFPVVGSGGTTYAYGGIKDSRRCGRIAGWLSSEVTAKAEAYSALMSAAQEVFLSDIGLDGGSLIEDVEGFAASGLKIRHFFTSLSNDGEDFADWISDIQTCKCSISLITENMDDCDCDGIFDELDQLELELQELYDDMFADASESGDGGDGGDGGGSGGGSGDGGGSGGGSGNGGGSGGGSGGGTDGPYPSDFWTNPDNVHRNRWDKAVVIVNTKPMAF